MSDAYQGHDEDLALLEHAMELGAEELLEASDELRAVLNALPDEIFLLDAQAKVLLHKPGTPPVLELAGSPVGQGLRAVVPPVFAEPMEQAQLQLGGGAEQVGFEVQACVGGDGVLRDCEVRMVPLHGGRCVALLRNISDRKAAERRIEHLAFHDALTGLPNRLRFQDELVRGMERARASGRHMAVMFLDVDRFKYVNDTFGHATGDELLLTLADRLRVVLGDQAEAAHLIARMGGDEFTVILHDLSHAEAAMATCAAIGAAGAQPVQLFDTEVYTPFSIGLSVFPDHGDTVEALLRNADAAMYHAKSAGRNNAQLYHPSMNAACTNVMHLEAALRRAVAAEALELVYQPIVCARTGVPQSLEALVRWQDRDLGAVSPEVFIPIAEESDLILDIGRFVVRATCRQIRRWLDAGFSPPKTSINLSCRHLWRGEVVRLIRAALEEHRVPPRLLGIEMTETAMVRNTDQARQTIVGLQALGLTISLDDFGTGYSSLGYLKQFPVDILKVDRSFVRDISSDQEDAALVRAVIAMGQGLGLRVVAEGVEDLVQLHFLRQHGCCLIQGHLVCEPCGPEALRTFVEDARIVHHPIPLSLQG